MMSKIADFVFDSATSAIKFLIVLGSLVFAGYNHFLAKIDKRVSETKEELLVIRSGDVKVMNEEVKNIKDGISDLKDSNKLILNHLLRRR